MTNRSIGSSLHGWALFAGTPASIAAFCSPIPLLGVLTLAAAVTAFAIGSRLEAISKAEELEEKRRHQTDRTRFDWADQMQALVSEYDHGDIDSADFADRCSHLWERFPR